MQKSNKSTTIKSITWDKTISSLITNSLRNTSLNYSEKIASLGSHTKSNIVLVFIIIEGRKSILESSKPSEKKQCIRRKIIKKSGVVKKISEHLRNLSNETGIAAK